MKARVYPVTAPVGGLNARDSISDMPESDALELTNWFCEPDYVRVRRGHEQFATGIGATPDGVKALFAWDGPASSKLFAASTEAIYDITSGGAVGVAAVSGLAGGDWQEEMMATSGGNFLVIANGIDPVYHFDGTTWTVPTITGVSSSALRSPMLHKRRLWFIQINSTKGWYLGTDSVAGAAASFDFGPLFSEGGSLLAAGTMTRDGGDGPDDYACFVSDTGEIAVYAGTVNLGACWRLSCIGTYWQALPCARWR